MPGLFGDKAIAAIDHHGFDGGLVVATVYVAGQNITPVDNAHYDQYLIHNALYTTASRLSQIDASWMRSHPVTGDSLCDAFHRLCESDQWGDHHVFDWQPCTNRFRCAVIPWGADLQLCCGPRESPRTMHAVKITPSRVASYLLEARRHIVDASPNQHLVLEPGKIRDSAS